MNDHDEIYLEPMRPDNSYDSGGRAWCAYHVWFESQGEPTRYVRADRYDDLVAENKRLKEELESKSITESK